ncbi:DUF3499 domain-containing protein [Mycobacterium sp. 852002-51057_SCH5723018]|uniref:DUF3499 domain-containing protein n=1 Tax=Mycobacterium sp. 852002-51057_SCH5723018 TaxID=1834094 RepID=UPI0018D33496|nr:DUF3499 domain-containing protein [Mycobacterium sp. 852002-51057_SCH5723018]
MNVPRRCCRPGCPHYAVATLTFVYSDSTAVVGPLATAREPHSWDLCVGHAGRITAPRGWDLVRHAGQLLSEPTHPDEDDLVALADAVREGGPRERARAHGATGTPLNGFDGFADSHIQHAGAHAAAPCSKPSAGLLAPAEHRSGRRRGHLRVLPDPSD